VYLDASLSMPGYVAADGQTIYGRVLQELRGFATTLDPRLEVVVRCVGTSVGTPASNLLLSVASRNQSFYHEQDTDLAGAINAFSERMGPAQPNGPPARYHILVTDGVQSTRHEQAALSCDSGSDQLCVRQRILALLDKGWGGCILGIRSQFHGFVYSELNRLEGKPYAVRYDSNDKNRQTFRPFYVYMFSPHQSALAKTVEELKERIRPLVGNDGMRELALTLPYQNGWARGELQIPKESSAFLNQSSAMELNPTRFTLRVSFDVKPNNAKSFNISVGVGWSSHAQDSGTPEELANLIQWYMVPVDLPGSSALPGSNGDGDKAAQGPNRGHYPEVKIERVRGDGTGKQILELKAYWPQSVGDPQWRVYRIEGRLNLAKRVPPWVQQWSTTDDRETRFGHKTFDLESALLNLWRNPALNNQVVAKLYLRIGPP
jgi:hypothetical protein